MISSRDLALVILFATLSFTFMILIGQVPDLITGIPGIGYAFTIVYATNQSVAILMYEGRRWRIFAQGLLVGLLNISFITALTPFVVGMATILNSFIKDAVFNSYYGYFEQKKKLSWWAILSLVYYYTTHPLLIVLFSSLLFYPFEVVMANWYVPIMSVMLPIMIIEAIAGGYLGYQIYRRVKKVQNY